MGNNNPFANTEGDSAYTEVVETEQFGPETKRCYEHLTSRVIGQDRAARKIARGLAVHYSGLGEPGKPIGSFLFSGPTGWGKTFLAQELGRFLIADVPHAPITHIQCGKSRESHRVSEIIGSPPGYVGWDKPPKLHQAKIDNAHFWIKVRPFLKDAFARAGSRADPDDVIEELYHEHKPYYSVVLFDEVEKAHPDIWNGLLHIMGDGHLELGNGDVTDFSNSMVIMTCNVGGAAQQKILEGGPKRIGYDARKQVVRAEMTDEEREEDDGKIFRETMSLIENTFPPELIGRLSEGIVVFRTLNRVQQRQILEGMLLKIQNRFSGKVNDGAESVPQVPPAIVLFSDRAKEYILDEGIDSKLGMRKLQAAVARLVLAPLANAIESKGLVAQDEVLVDVNDGKIVIRRKRGQALLLPPPIPVGESK